MQHQESLINGLVLCGGQSIRMGKDKGEIFYYDKNQRNHVYEMLSFNCAATFISCNAAQSKSITGLPKIEDAFVNMGPLGGVLSAFQFNPNVAWLVAACDLPFLNYETITFLIHHRNPKKMATAFWDAEAKFPEPLITIWEPCAYAVLSTGETKTHKSLRKILMNAEVEILHAPDNLALKNINTKQEYEEALLLLNKQA